MKRKAITKLPEPTEAEIQHAAYLLWLEEGQPEGRDVQHWFAARERLLHRGGRDARTRRPALEISTTSRTVSSGNN